MTTDFDFPGLRDGQPVASAAQAINVGRDLRAELERVARQEGRDAMALAPEGAARLPSVSE